MLETALFWGYNNEKLKHRLVGPRCLLQISKMGCEPKETQEVTLPDMYWKPRCLDMPVSLFRKAKNLNAHVHGSARGTGQLELTGQEREEFSRGESHTRMGKLQFQGPE